MKIVFVDNFFYTRVNGQISVDVSPHLGLMSLATLLEQAGHQVAIFDPKQLFRGGQFALPQEDFLRECAARIVAQRPDIVGFTALGRTLPYAVQMAAEVKANLVHVPIIVGGPHATIVGEAMLREFDCFDVVVRYEAEPMIVDLCQRLVARKAIDDIPNLAYRDGGTLCSTLALAMLPDMDSLPEPAMHLYPEESVRNSEIALEAGRGCPFACTFCSTANFFKRRYRLKSSDRLIAEMERARERYGVTAFLLNHDLFGLHKASLREFCTKVAGRGFTWKCSMRPDTIDLRMLNELVDAGCVDIYFGLETGSERLQTLTKKKLDLVVARQAIREVASAGLTCTASFIVGFPEESRNDLDATLDLIGELLAFDARAVTVQLHILSPEPGSELATRHQATRFDGIGPELDDLVDDALILSSPELFSVFYHFDTLLPRAQIIFASALVSYLLPQLGAAMTTHLLERHFNGSLAQLFMAVVPEDAECPTSYADTVESLWNGMQRVAEAIGREHPYVLELVRLSRILATGSNLSQGADPRAALDADAPTVCLLAQFGDDIVELADRVLRIPAGAIEARPAAAEHWFLITLDPHSDPSLRPIPVGEGRALYEAGQAADTDDGLASRCFPELRMLALFGDSVNRELMRELNYG